MSYEGADILSTRWLLIQMCNKCTRQRLVETNDFSLYGCQRHFFWARHAAESCGIFAVGQRIHHVCWWCTETLRSRTKMACTGQTGKEWQRKNVRGEQVGGVKYFVNFRPLDWGRRVFQKSTCLCVHGSFAKSASLQCLFFFWESRNVTMFPSDMCSPLFSLTAANMTSLEGDAARWGANLKGRRPPNLIQIETNASVLESKSCCQFFQTIAAFISSHSTRSRQ